MRVNPNNAPDLMTALHRIAGDENTVLRQLASGKRIQNPSDDPAGMAALVELQSADANTQQYLRNVSSVRSVMQMSDSTLSAVVTNLERAITLGVAGANGTLNDADRNATAIEIEGIADHVLDLANSSLQGTYLFAGTAAMMKPFASNTGTVMHQGSANTNQIQIGEGLWIRAGVWGPNIFGTDGNNVFDSLKQLADAVRNQGELTLRSRQCEVHVIRYRHRGSLMEAP